MPRIAKEEHAKIRERVEIGGEKVAAVAAGYGCTPANIYAILAKLRQAGGEPAVAGPLPAAPELPSATAVLPVQQLEFLTSSPPQHVGEAAPPPPDPVPAAAPPEPPARSVPARPSSQGHRSSSAAPRVGCFSYVLLMLADDGE